jgi:hypothetical protein
MDPNFLEPSLVFDEDEFPWDELYTYPEPNGEEE